MTLSDVASPPCFDEVAAAVLGQSHQRAAWLDKPGPEAHVRIRNDLDIPKPGADEVLVKLEYTGVW